MGVPVGVHPASNETTSSEWLQRHLRHREAAIGAIIIVGLVIVALVLAFILFPRVAAIATFFYFAYMLLFTLPMWAGLLEDDIEEERHRYEGET